MSSRLRSLDSKISFFAFADIITAVSGVLIFIALLLATDLGRPTDSQPSAATSETEQQLREVLAQQEVADAQNHRLQELLASADTAPDLEKLHADIARLRSQLSEAKNKQAVLASQMAGSQAALAARDQALGLTDLKARIKSMVQKTELIAQQEAEARSEMDGLEQQVTLAESRLLKLRQREGQLWLIPDKNATTKEPILVTVAGTGATIERFDHPDQRKQLEYSGADAAFKSYLGKTKSLDNYVVFLVRPSGIELFQSLVKSGRDLGFNVGFDALEEDREIHFSTPPAVDESIPATAAPAAVPTAQTSASDSHSGSSVAAVPEPTPPNTAKPQPSAASGPPAPQKEKSWWQKLLVWVGLG